MPQRLPAGLRCSVVRVEVPPATARSGRTGGDFVETFVPSGGPWYVAIRDAGGGEHAALGTSIGSETHMVTGPYRPDVTVRARLVRATGRPLNVVAVDWRDDRRAEIVARCTEAAT